MTKRYFYSLFLILAFTLSLSVTVLATNRDTISYNLEDIFGTADITKINYSEVSALRAYTESLPPENTTRIALQNKKNWVKYRDQVNLEEVLSIYTSTTGVMYKPSSVGTVFGDTLANFAPNTTVAGYILAPGLSIAEILFAVGAMTLGACLFIQIVADALAINFAFWEFLAGSEGTYGGGGGFGNTAGTKTRKGICSKTARDMIGRGSTGGGGGFSNSQSDSAQGSRMITYIKGQWKEIVATFVIITLTATNLWIIISQGIISILSYFINLLISFFI